MPKENMHEQLVNQELQPPPNKSEDGIELHNSPELEETTNIISQINQAIATDSPVTAQSILELKESIAELTVDINGEQVPLKDIKDIPDIKDNINIWQEIKQDNLANISKITYITPGIAQILSKHQGDLYLRGLTTLSDIAAEHLSNHQGTLDLDGLTTLSDKAAEHLSKHEGDL